MADKPDAPEDEEVEDDGVGQADAPWDEQTDAFVEEIDESVASKYGVSLRALLMDPAQYADTKDILDTVKKIKAEVDEYFDGLMSQLKVEQDDLTKELENSDAVYAKVDQAISSKAAVARVPYLEPVDMDMGNAIPEIIFIDQYNNNVDSLITKFVNISNYIANLSTTYKKYKVGSWLFSGERTYNLAVKRPESMVITVEDAQEYLDNAIDESLDTISGIVTTK